MYWMIASVALAIISGPLMLTTKSFHSRTPRIAVAVALQAIITLCGWATVLGGDCATGPATAIRAIAGGKVAAYAIDEYLGYHHTLQCDLGEPTLLHNNRVPTGRVNIQERSSHERKQDFEHVEYPITVEEAVQECRRCLRCDKFGCGVLEGAAE